MEIEQCDYREDKVINGVLCFLHEGEWQEYSKEELTDMYLSEQATFEGFIDRVSNIEVYGNR